MFVVEFFKTMAKFCVIYVSALFLSISALGLSLPVEDGVKICETEACKLAAQNLKNSIDSSIDPCDDFYHYACGNYPKMHAPNGYMPIDYFTTRTEENEKEILDFVRKNDTDDEPEAVHKIRKLYSQCLNQDKQSSIDFIDGLLRETIGIPIEVSSSNNTSQDFDYIEALAKLVRKTGIGVFFSFGISANPYDRATNAIALKASPSSTEFSTSTYNQMVKDVQTKSKDECDEQMKQCENSTTLFCKYCDSYHNALSNFIISEIKSQNSKRSKIISKTQPAFVTYSSMFSIYTLQDLQNLTNSIAIEVNSTIPTLNWTRFIEVFFEDTQNIPFNFDDTSKIKVVIVELDTFRDMLKFMLSRSLEEIKYTIWYEVLSKLGLFVSLPSAGITTREKACSTLVISSFGMIVSHIYSTKENYTKAKSDVHKIYKYIGLGMKEIIEQSSWMDEKTRERALNKLSSMKSFVIYPPPSLFKLDEVYSSINVSGSFLSNTFSFLQSEIRKLKKSLNQTNDLSRDSGRFSPNLVNAYNNMLENTIIIPAAVLAQPIYHSDNLAALNYGSIGSLVGHELTHGFDNTGRQFNELGNIEDWWQEETLEKYIAKGRCFVKAYDKYSTSTNKVALKGNSKLTLGEDISDNGGFKEALFAYRKYISENGKEPLLPQFENFTHEQLLVLSFANLWCETPTILSAMAAKNDVHSPKGVRVNGVLKNSNEFAEIWKCPKGSEMNPLEEKCSVW